MVDFITNAFRVLLFFLLVPLMLYASVIYPLTLIWILWKHGCRMVAISLKIRRRLAGRRGFSIFRSRRKRGNDIFWRIEGPQIIRIGWILLFTQVPVILALLISAILGLLR
jgi:hypothetical protein